ncbi:MAG: choice-of-anchor M domain-containing protein [Bifidobacteriaceae bacterium]|nr:choice-of-anchor M domain-containing protein [Bifidobacteriaceae bacterium]
MRAYALTQGHIDLFEVTYSPAAEGLVLGVKDDTRLYSQSTEYRDPADVSIVVDQAKSLADLSGAASSFDFLKADGNSVYVLPQSQAADLPWPGWSTERLAATGDPWLARTAALAALAVLAGSALAARRRQLR